jgi:hypothetical protein
MTNIDEAALRRNTFPNNSTASIEVVTSSPNLFGPEPTTTCQRCGKSFEPIQRGGKPQRYCSVECRKGRAPNDQTNAERTTKGTPTNAEVVHNGVHPDVHPDAGDEASAFPDHENVVLQAQDLTSIYFNNDNSLVIRQHRWPDEDHWIIVTRDNIETFLDELTDRCGVPSVGK